MYILRMAPFNHIFMVLQLQSEPQDPLGVNCVKRWK